MSGGAKKMSGGYGMKKAGGRKMAGKKKKMM